MTKQLNLWLGAMLVGLVVGAGALAPLLTPFDPLHQDLGAALLAPSATHWFGTDQYGRDIMTRTLFGARLSLIEIIVGVGLAMAAGVPLGLLAGYAGARVDAALSWAMNVLFAFPGIVLAILIVSVLGTNLLNLLIGIAIFSVPVYFRLSRGLAIKLREMEFTQAAVAVGAGLPRVLFHHILRNALAPLIVQATLGAGTVVLAAASLSFLGLGPQPPAPEWGAMMSTGRDFVGVDAYLSLFPGLAITVAVLGFNLLGDGLRDLLDPRK